MYKRLFAGLVLMVFVIAVCVAVPEERLQNAAVLSSAKTTEPKKTIIIDAGHGGLTNTID